MTSNKTLASGLFAAGDYGAAALLGVVTAAAVRAVVTPEMHMVLAMLVGMGLGMGLHLVLGLLLTPLLGLFHVMAPGSLVGMYGGMLFAMRDSMQMHSGSLGQALIVGALFGVVVTAGVQLYDRAAQSPA